MKKQSKEKKKQRRNRRKAKKDKSNSIFASNKENLMRSIIVPKPIPVKGMDGEIKPYPFKKMLTTAVNSNPKYGKGLSNIRRGGKLIDLLENCVEGEEFVMEDADHEDYLSSFEATEWIPQIVIQLIPLVDIFEKAKTFKVEESPKEKEGDESPKDKDEDASEEDKPTAE